MLWDRVNSKCQFSLLLHDVMCDRKGKRHRKLFADGNSLAFEVTGHFCLSVS